MKMNLAVFGRVATPVNPGLHLAVFGRVATPVNPGLHDENEMETK